MHSFLGCHVFEFPSFCMHGCTKTGNRLAGPSGPNLWFCEINNDKFQTAKLAKDHSLSKGTSRGFKIILEDLCSSCDQEPTVRLKGVSIP